MKHLLSLFFLGFLCHFPASAQRPYTVVRQPGQDGVHTCRIPGLATTPKGTLLAIYDARYESSRDLQGRMAIGLSRSTDRGRTWHASAPAASQTTECAVAELGDGLLMLNMRNNRRTGRVVCTTADLGESWQVHPTSEKALVEPVCMASLHRHVYTEKGTARSVLLFCNPASAIAT